jgi:MoxR-like ATPase
MNQKLQAVIAETEKAVIGKRNTLLWVTLALLAGGHILLEDIPGVGKTTMALAFWSTSTWASSLCMPATPTSDIL